MAMYHQRLEVLHHRHQAGLRYLYYWQQQQLAISVLRFLVLVRFLVLSLDCLWRCHCPHSLVWPCQEAH